MYLFDGTLNKLNWIELKIDIDDFHQRLLATQIYNPLDL
jgi:hypothetical protein